MVQHIVLKTVCLQHTRVQHTRVLLRQWMRQWRVVKCYAEVQNV